MDKYAPAKIAGDINLLSAALYTDLKVSFKGVEMTSVTPYSGRFAGYKIEKGKLSIDVAYLVENRTLQAQSRNSSSTSSSSANASRAKMPCGCRSSWRWRC